MDVLDAIEGKRSLVNLPFKQEIQGNEFDMLLLGIEDLLRIVFKMKLVG